MTTVMTFFLRKRMKTLEDTRLLDFGPVDLVVAVVVLHQVQDIVHRHAGDEGGAQPVVDHPVVDLHLLALRRTGLHLDHVQLAAPQLLPNLPSSPLREVAEVEERPLPVDLVQQALLGESRVPAEGLEGVGFKLGDGGGAAGDYTGDGQECHDEEVAHRFPGKGWRSTVWDPGDHHRTGQRGGHVGERRVGEPDSPSRPGGREGRASPLASRLEPVDRVVLVYALWVAVLVAARAPHVARWSMLLSLHAGIVALVVLLPARAAGAAPAAGPAWRRHGTEVLRFVRHAYPLALVLVFFEEVRYTVNAVFPGTPYWFEPWLYAADRTLFGTLPARALAPTVDVWTSEIMHGLYFVYYPILLGGLVLAWRRPGGGPGPAPAFRSTLLAMTCSFVLAFLPYPFLAARGPWENAPLMAELPDFHGPVFTPLMERIIDHGAVSGGCFPSAHVAGAWGIVHGLASAGRRRAAWSLGLLSAGMSFACVWTRYHHAVDVPAGVACALLGGWIASRLNGRAGASTAG